MKMRLQIFRSMCLLVTAAVLMSAGGFVLAGYLSPDDRLPSGEYYLAGMLIVTAAGLACCVLAWVLSYRIIRPIISSGEDAATVYEELSHLSHRLENQRSLIRASSDRLLETERGLNTIMKYMTEGLALLDLRGLVISINRSAVSLLNLRDADYTGKHIFAANSDPILQAAVYMSITGEKCEERIRVNDTMLQIMTNPVMVDGSVRAVVLLIFDVTERYEAESMRREFTANVSHELKTPLTSISGYAEIMKDGIVKSDDVRKVAESIYNEAQRLIELIEDIIRLSQLDEEVDVPREDINLYELAAEVAERLESKAVKYEVDVAIDGSDEIVHGNRQILDEIIYNLCDNAIKYNKPGGRVDIIISREDGGVNLAVRDTGIGIPRDLRERVFERFYRVDKSHSKKTGGTGLGLSIVKHGAKFHDAEIDISSTPGEGTQVAVRFKR